MLAPTVQYAPLKPVVEVRHKIRDLHVSKYFSKMVAGHTKPPIKKKNVGAVFVISKESKPATNGLLNTEHVKIPSKHIGTVSVAKPET